MTADSYNNKVSTFYVIGQIPVYDLLPPAHGNM